MSQMNIMVESGRMDIVLRSWWWIGKDHDDGVPVATGWDPSRCHWITQPSMIDSGPGILSDGNSDSSRNHLPDSRRTLG